MILTDARTDAIRRRLRDEVERGLTAKGVSGRRASIDVVGNDGLIRDIRAGRIPSVDRLAALFEYLGLPFSFGGTAAPAQGFAEQRRETPDLLRREALRAGFLPFPYHRLSGRRGTAPVAFANAWLQDMGLDPEQLSVVAPDISLLPSLARAATLALVAQTAARTGNDAWCFAEGGQTVLARLHWPDAATLIVAGDDPARPARVVQGGDRARLTILGRVVWTGQAWP